MHGNVTCKRNARLARCDAVNGSYIVKQQPIMCKPFSDVCTNEWNVGGRGRHSCKPLGRQ